LGVVYVPPISQPTLLAWALLRICNTDTYK
jgi:hypothetical protein